MSLVKSSSRPSWLFLLSSKAFHKLLERSVKLELVVCEWKCVILSVKDFKCPQLLLLHKIPELFCKIPSALEMSRVLMAVLATLVLLGICLAAQFERVDLLPLFAQSLIHAAQVVAHHTQLVFITPLCCRQLIL